MSFQKYRQMPRPGFSDDISLETSRQRGYRSKSTKVIESWGHRLLRSSSFFRWSPSLEAHTNNHGTLQNYVDLHQALQGHRSRARCWQLIGSGTGESKKPHVDSCGVEPSQGRGSHRGASWHDPSVGVTAGLAWALL